jgi:indolepyruvate ferredoxin oxidoreductase beta subunit
MTPEKKDVLMVGVGGQGIILASDILSQAAISANCDVKKTDTIGMAQRGGSVLSHIRIASHIWSPMIKEGEADILVAFEKLEAVRYLSYLKPNGLAIINDYIIPPLSVSVGTSKYPGNNEIKDAFKQKSIKAYFIDGSGKASATGDIRTLNTFMLGCISHFLSIDLQIWQQCISKILPAKVLEINNKAFELGRKEIANVNLK